MCIRDSAALARRAARALAAVAPTRVPPSPVPASSRARLRRRRAVRGVSRLILRVPHARRATRETRASASARICAEFTIGIDDRLAHSSQKRARATRRETGGDATRRRSTRAMRARRRERAERTRARDRARELAERDGESLARRNETTLVRRCARRSGESADDGE